MTFRYVDIMTDLDFPLFFRFQILQIIHHFQYIDKNQNQQTKGRCKGYFERRFQFLLNFRLPHIYTDKFNDTIIFEHHSV